MSTAPLGALVEEFRVDDVRTDELPPSYNVAPTDAVYRTCVIVTTAANAVVGGLHDRMPVILPARYWDRWLDPTHRDQADLMTLLVPAADELLDLHPVTTKVNSVRNNGPELIHPESLPEPPSATLFD